MNGVSYITGKGKAVVSTMSSRTAQSTGSSSGGGSRGKGLHVVSYTQPRSGAGKNAPKPAVSVSRKTGATHEAPKVSSRPSASELTTKKEREKKS